MIRNAAAFFHCHVVDIAWQPHILIAVADLSQATAAAAPVLLMQAGCNCKGPSRPAVFKCYDSWH
jgi:hypothetical protein